ncbi:hypothetical protein A3F08_00050 [Candidatus Berkelbacteria bacterium RIFCSPHIGHO2_12_FULL_36_9]|uniref:TVP38/TMEM64 family membrane protein n=1 Tax=Candidatus Berkelbacteria bacterium RIFCSPHIGHO2_12_FULL_36_9 TaxID=1797469 RepID=A0A1F5EEQ2_9BACT|nr:MAG: hypothetical protein A3F08_00050 [Candidatus Berkelbacteria bacterium RIFCSPHIGHO2_12_FULL_36_9]
MEYTPFEESNRLLQEQIKRYKKWQYKNTALLILGLITFFYFVESHIVQNAISQIGNWGYIGAFLVGIFFVSTFTVVPAMYVLYVLADKFNPFEVAVFAGLGALLGDYLIFRFLKDKIFEELKPIFLKLGGNYLIRIFRTPYFAWFVPFVGTAIIASPLPDETGIGILGLSKLKNWQFMLLSFFLNATGIFIIVTLAKSF